MFDTLTEDHNNGWSVFNSIRRLVISPNQFFASKQQDPELLGPAVIVALTGMFYGLSGLVMLPVRTHQYQGEAVAYLYVGVAFSWVTTVLMTVLLWVFYAGAFFMIATLLFDSEGEFRNVFALTGWGFVGQLCAAVISVLSKLYILQQVGSTAQAEVIGQIQTHPAFIVASIVGFLMFLWSAYLWNYAVQYTFYLSLIKSIVTVGIPVVLSIGLFYVSTIPGLI